MRRGTIEENLTRVFGRGFTRSAILSSVLLAILCFFYIYSAASHLAVRVYPLIDRVTYYTPFIVYVVNEYADHIIIGSLLILWIVVSSKRSKYQLAAIGVFGVLFAALAASVYDSALDGIALASLPAIVFLLVCDRYFSKRIFEHTPNLTLNYLSVLGIIIGIMGLAYAVIQVSLTEPVTGSPIRNYAYDIFLILSSFTAIFIVFLMAGFPIKFLINHISARLSIHDFSISYIRETRVGSRRKLVYLFLIVLLSIIISLVPHLPAVNPDSAQIGTDSRDYVVWVAALSDSESMSEFLYQAFIKQNTGERPLTLILLYFLHVVSDEDLFYVIEYSPVVLAPCLVVTMFLLTKELTNNEITSLIAAFLTATSFHVLIGIYAGFYANWLALIFGYLSVLFLFRFLKNGKKADLMLHGGLMIITLFTHVYTWSVLAIFVGAFLSFLTFNRKRAYYGNMMKKLILLFLALFMTVAIDVMRTEFTESSGGIERDIQFGEMLTGPEQFVLRWNNLYYATTTYIGGLFANFIIFGLGMYWLVRANTNEISVIVIMTFFSIAILAFFFGNYVIQARILYNIPVEVPAAMVIANLSKDAYSRRIRTIALYIWLIVISIIAASNFYLRLPG